MVIELHWDLPLEIMEVHEFWHPGWRSPSQQKYVMVDTTGRLLFCLGPGRNRRARQGMEVAFAQQHSLALTIAVNQPVRDL